MKHGTVARVDNEGTIISMWVELDFEPGQGNALVPVYWDHRPFADMVRDRGGMHNVLRQPVTILEEADRAGLPFDYFALTFDSEYPVPYEGVRPFHPN